jgi:beta-1,4-mannosyl-glycoprotein beta-1,4-N-acetylglucosaminyltransferase
MSKIYDCFLFFNELDLLEIRLKALYPYVDYFIISECDYTFSGMNKPFYYEENKHLFEQYADKIIHIKNYNSDRTDNFVNEHKDTKFDIFESIVANFNVIKHTQETGFGLPHWCRDYLHREYIGLGFNLCNDDDIIMISDTDEIPNPDIIKNIPDLDLDNNMYCLRMDCHNYFVNNLSSTNWMGTVITKFDKIKNKTICTVRRSRNTYHMIYNAGWHLSFIGGAERIRTKIESYSHQEMNNDYIKNNIVDKINQNKDIFNRSNNTYHSDSETYYYDNLKVINVDDYYPSDLLDLIKTKFPYLIK